MDPELARKRWDKAVSHLLFAIELYKLQMESGRLFVHEHPLGASSWNIPDMTSLMNDPRVMKVHGDQCMFGLVTEVAGAVIPAKKPTGFLTNCPDIAAELDVRCDGSHPHGHLISGRAGKASKYPDGLCKAICRGLHRHLSRRKMGEDEPHTSIGDVAIQGLGVDGQWTPLVTEDLRCTLDIIREQPVESAFNIEVTNVEKQGQPEEVLELPWKIDGGEWMAIDDVKGGPLDLSDVTEARDKEM
eukprot:6794343-Karenia_brevis.AAC.1